MFILRQQRMVDTQKPHRFVKVARTIVPNIDIAIPKIAKGTSSILNFLVNINVANRMPIHL